MATPLGTTSFTDEEVVAQSDVNLVGTVVETLVIEFDQAKYEALLSAGSLSPKARCKIRESQFCVSPTVHQPRVEITPQRRLVQSKREAQARVHQSKREAQARVHQSKREAQARVHQLKRGALARVHQLKRGALARVHQLKRGALARVHQLKRGALARVHQLKRGALARVHHLKRGFQARVHQLKRGAHTCVHHAKREAHVSVNQAERNPRVCTQVERDPCVHVTKCDFRVCLDKGDEVHCGFNIHGTIQDTAELEYSKVTINMVGRGKSPVSNADEPEVDQSPGLKEVLNDLDGVYRHTRTRTGAISPLNYQRLAKGLRSDDEHSAIAESQSSSSFEEHERAVHMADGTEDLKKRFEECQAMMQESMRAQQEALRAQQESIDQLREMMAQIIADRAQFQMSGPTPQQESSRRRSRSSKRKEKVSEASDQEAHHTESSFEEEKRTENEQDPQSAKMLELEARLNAMANRCELQDQGVVRPYPAGWDTVPYPAKFKIPTLQAFDGTGSPNQHIYHFKSQTGNAMSNDAILARLFIGTLKGVAFEWFMKLPTGCIQKWADLERLFLSRFFEDDTEISVTSLLAIKQKEGEPIKAFVERFRSTALRCSTGMTQSALIDTCRHNLQTNLLARMGVVKCHSWKQLVSQGEQAEVIIARVEAEEETNSEDQAIDDSALNCEADSENSDSINLE